MTQRIYFMWPEEKAEYFALSPEDQFAYLSNAQAQWDEWERGAEERERREAEWEKEEDEKRAAIKKSQAEWQRKYGGLTREQIAIRQGEELRALIDAEREAERTANTFTFPYLVGVGEPGSKKREAAERYITTISEHVPPANAPDTLEVAIAFYTDDPTVTFPRKNIFGEIGADEDGLSEEEKAADAAAGFRRTSRHELPPIKVCLFVIPGGLAFETIGGRWIKIRVLEMYPQLIEGINSRNERNGWILPPEVMEEVSPISSPVARSHKAKEPREILPAHLPQSTFMEARAFAHALSDGRDGRNWFEIEGTAALLHSAPEAPHSTRFEPSAMLLGWWGLSMVEGETLRDELRKHDFDSIILFHVILSGILHDSKARFTISIDGLIKLINRDTDARRSSADRERLRRKVWRSIVVFDSMLVFGARPGFWREPAPSGERRERMAPQKLYSRDPLIRIVGTDVTEQGTFDNSAPPKEVSLTVGQWAMKFHGNREFLSEIGNILRLAEIPRGTPTGAFAANLALMLNQRWREEATKAERTRTTRHTSKGDEKVEALKMRPFTRRELLAGMVRSDYDVEQMLRDPKSNYRVPEYFDGAIKKLKKRGDIGYYKELPSPPSETWQDKWLDQPIEIRATGEVLASALEIKKSSEEKKRRGRPRKTKEPEE
ncbi:hypothetical protein EON83_27805 [bacterium]|nr:MAG: hypothetical protein EON83_27805 [bacterium]